MDPSVLVVDDDVKTAELVRLYLEREHYRVLVAHDGRRALELGRQKRPDLIVLDLMLPKVDGLDVCRILRAESEVPIIMLTARSTEDDVLLGLDLGADDYLAKPFSPRELVARVRALLRRAARAEPPPERLELGALTLDLGRHEVRLGGELLRLTPKEFGLLATLMREPGRVFSRLELLERAFGFDYEGLERTVDVHVMKLRRKLRAVAPTADHIETVYGIGYRMSDRDAPS